MLYMRDYHKKYLKYKTKYIKLKYGGSNENYTFLHFNDDNKK